ncbi:hypothetical protein MRX96_015183 [Rhipicephalus microplus]
MSVQRLAGAKSSPPRMAGRHEFEPYDGPPYHVDSTPTGRTGVSAPASALPASSGCRRRPSGRRAPAAARLLRRAALVEDDVVLVAASDEDELFLPLSKGLRVMRDVSSDHGAQGQVGSNKIPFNHRQRVQPDGSLSISNVQQVSDDGNYVCRFTDSRNQKHTGNVLLKVIEPPVISHYEFRKDMQVGMRIKVFCTVVQGDPPFLFTWLKDGVPVVENGAPSSQAALNVHNERDYSMLSTDSLQLEHSGNYTCVVKNQAATTAYSAVLRVNEPPKWDVEPESAAVVQGRNVQLQCSASGTPQPIITWMIASDSTREEFLPLYNSHKYGLFPNGTLSIHQLEPEESGYYLCKASNGFGEDLSKLVFLTVKHDQFRVRYDERLLDWERAGEGVVGSDLGAEQLLELRQLMERHLERPPKFDVKFRAHAVKRGEKARLQCTAIGDLPIAITWSKNNDRVPEKTKYKYVALAPFYYIVIPTSISKLRYEGMLPLVEMTRQIWRRPAEDDVVAYITYRDGSINT